MVMSSIVKSALKIASKTSKFSDVSFLFIYSDMNKFWHPC